MKSDGLAGHHDPDGFLVGSLLKLVSDSDDHADKRQPAGVRIIAKLEALNGAVFFALAGAVTGAAVAAPSDAAMLYLACVAVCLYFLAALFVIGGRGLLEGRPWAQSLAVYLAISFIALGANSLFHALWGINRRPSRIKILTVIIAACFIVAGAVILWYLHRPHVNRYFDGTYGSLDTGRRAWFWWLCKTSLREFRPELGEMLENYSTPFWDTLNGLRVILDKIL